MIHVQQELTISSFSRRLSDVLKRKKPPKRGGGRKGSRGEEAVELGWRGSPGSRPSPTTRGKALAGRLCEHTHPPLLQAQGVSRQIQRKVVIQIRVLLI